jgi:hypothetical protein
MEIQSNNLLLSVIVRGDNKTEIVGVIDLRISRHHDQSIHLHITYHYCIIEGTAREIEPVDCTDGFAEKKRCKITVFVERRNDSRNHSIKQQPHNTLTDIHASTATVIPRDDLCCCHIASSSTSKLLLLGRDSIDR